MKSLTILVAYLSLPWLSLATQADALIIVADHGGTSALPYYEALNLQPRAEVSAPLTCAGRDTGCLLYTSRCV